MLIFGDSPFVYYIIGEAWKDIDKQRDFFDELARERGFDLQQNSTTSPWYSITHHDVITRVVSKIGPIFGFPLKKWVFATCENLKIEIWIYNAAWILKIRPFLVRIYEWRASLPQFTKKPQKRRLKNSFLAYISTRPRTSVTFHIFYFIFYFLGGKGCFEFVWVVTY